MTSGVVTFRCKRPRIFKLRLIGYLFTSWKYNDVTVSLSLPASSHLSPKEGTQMLEVLLPLIDMGEVCGIVQCNPFDLLNVVKEWLHRHVLGFILHAVDQEGGGLNITQLRDASPVTKRARNI